MYAGLIGWLIGAFAITFLLSRAVLSFLKSWNGGVKKIIFAHVFCLMFAGLVGGVGFADGGPFAGLPVMVAYLPPQAFWMFVDIWRSWRQAREGQK